MNVIQRSSNWFFAEQNAPFQWQRIIVWWEIRRIPYNLIVGFYGLICLVVFYWAINSSGQLKEGDDAIEPLALIFAPIGVNICYTLGWFVQLLFRKKSSPRFAPFLLKLGL